MCVSVEYHMGATKYLYIEYYCKNIDYQPSFL